MTDINTTPDETVDSFDVDGVFKQAQARVEAINRQIEREQAIKLSAETRIRSLREEKAKTERLVSAMTPRTRVVKPKEDGAKPAKKAGAAKKAATTAS